jgi:hypothetical protein
MDLRIKQLSYSSLLTFHSCPRKFQLYKLNATIEQDEDISRSLTFAYGHAVGKGIQDILDHKDEDQWLWEMFIEWDTDLLADNPKQNKSFWGAVLAIQQFEHMRSQGYLDGYELVQYKDAPAVELSFVIHLPDGFKYRGYVDAVLQHNETGKVLVLEVKTTSAYSVNPATYKNSAQAIGYSIVLDAIFPDLNAYEVLYLVYQTKSESYQQLPFEKSYYSRALWIRELLLDVEVIKMYEDTTIYPMRGESCFTYFRECEYFNTCTLSTENLITPPPPQEAIDEELAKFQIHVTLDDLIQSQLSKNAEPVLPTQGDEIL